MSDAATATDPTTGASWQTRVLCLFLRLAKRRRWTTAAAGERTLARAKGDPTPPRSLTRHREVTTRTVAGFAVHRVLPRSGVRERGAVVYLHGGAYVSEIVSQHWSLVADLADATGRPVHVPIYGLAPQHGALEARALASRVVAEAAAEGPVHLLGDSAGGGLALLAAQHLRDTDGPRPVGITVMAPWVDLTMANPGIDEIEPYDPWLARPGLRPVAAAWAGDVPLEDPRLSPIHGDLAGLPPITVHVGTRDITLADSRLLRDRVRAAGGTVHLDEVPGSPHVHPLLPTPEGRRARARLLAGVGGVA
ncbi:alpha/beta hydrolase fold domain-containing protein [Nocardioides sp. MJB4]|uniref:Alpha/beta hydrolase fold domain-containing protein n=1 Tax=Nocardioides donggukensis TaxID=2774019 RepID=A0A927K6E7_9ACTN|nr:alpha/beta hydrolase fold domain-containing protein [Nocardioides donggukensis]